MSTKTAPTATIEITEALIRESITLVDDRARRIRQSLALVIQYTRAEAIADHGAESGFEQDAMYKVEELLLEIHTDFESLMKWIERAADVLRTLDSSRNSNKPALRPNR